MDEIITLDNRDFVVVNKKTINDTNYIYAIASDGTNDLVLLQEVEENGETFVESVNDKEVFDKVLKLMVLE